MAINTNGSNIRSETNSGGTWKDAVSEYEQRQHASHNHLNTSSPWGTEYQPPQPIWEAEPAPPVELTPELKEALRRDLQRFGINTPSNDS
jgi:hypothetical protein